MRIRLTHVPQYDNAHPVTCHSRYENWTSIHAFVPCDIATWMRHNNYLRLATVRRSAARDVEQRGRRYKKSRIILPLKELRRFHVYVLWYDICMVRCDAQCWNTQSKSMLRDTWYHACHTIRHIHGNDVNPLREVWFVIFF